MRTSGIAVWRVSSAASALAAGCPVVVKAHPGHPQTSEAVHGLLRGALTAAELASEAETANATVALTVEEE